MKHIIIILLIILIVIFTAHKAVEYKRENLEELCDFNCGKHQTEGACLSCKNCGVCKLVKNNKIITYCLPGDKNGSFFNEECKGNTWNFAGETTIQPPTSAIVLDRKPRDYTISSSSTDYSDILKGMGQQVEEKNNVTGSTQKIGTTNIKEEDKQIGMSSINVENKSYDSILLELESLSNLLK